MIQVDLEMPKSCYVCKFRKCVLGSLCSCMLNEEKYYETETYKNKRSDWCPLKEIGSENKG